MSISIDISMPIYINITTTIIILIVIYIFILFKFQKYFISIFICMFISIFITSYCDSQLDIHKHFIHIPIFIFWNCKLFDYLNACYITIHFFIFTKWCVQKLGHAAHVLLIYNGKIILNNYPNINKIFKQ